jgi:hypothetical protein
MLEDLGLSIRHCLRPALDVALLGFELGLALTQCIRNGLFARNKPP